MKRGIAGIATAALATGLLALGPGQAAHAATTPDQAAAHCTAGTTRTDWTGTAKPWTVTHHWVTDWYTSSSLHSTVTTGPGRRLRASVATDARLTAAQQRAVLSALGRKAGVGVGLSGATTGSRVTFHLSVAGNHPDRYVAYRGQRSVSGEGTVRVCAANGRSWGPVHYVQTKTYGTAVGTGVLRCTGKPAKGTLAATVKKQYC